MPGVLNEVTGVLARRGYNVAGGWNIGDTGQSGVLTVVPGLTAASRTVK
jgi:hypothetical protein